MQRSETIRREAVETKQDVWESTMEDERRKRVRVNTIMIIATLQGDNLKMRATFEQNCVRPFPWQRQIDNSPSLKNHPDCLNKHNRE